MTKTKKNPTRATAQEPPTVRENLDELYMAHQVHTLAQMLLQQLACRQVQAGMPAVAFPSGHAGPQPSWPAFATVVASGLRQDVPGLNYWYP